MYQEGTAATALLGLPGFVWLAVSEHDGELEVAVETTEPVTGVGSAAWWRGCMIGGAAMCGIFPPPADR